MRSSKTRSRSKSNRNRSVGNIVNRVFDSSGPEGKVRGTPQQIIDKYNQLARDAQLGNDRVAAENFQQHAEHYTRMLSEAQREQEARREQQDRDRERQQQQNANGSGNRREQDAEARQDQPQGGGEQPRVEEQKPANDVFTVAGEEGESNLVETPESRPARSRRPRRNKADEARASEPAEGGDAPEAAQ